MSQEPDLIEFDDTEAIVFILKNLPTDIKGRVTHDDVQYVLDLICEYYEDNEIMEEDEAQEATIAEDDMFNNIWASIVREKVIEIDRESLAAILEGEFEYGKTLGIYTEEE